jgi:hypothetical protein
LKWGKFYDFFIPVPAKEIDESFKEIKIFEGGAVVFSSKYSILI